MQKKRYTIAIVISVLLHVVLFSLLFINLPKKSQVTAQKDNVIKAVAIQNAEPSVPPQLQPIAAEKIKNLEQKTLATKTSPVSDPIKSSVIEPEEKEKPIKEEQLEPPKNLAKKAQKLAEEKKKNELAKKKAVEKKHREQVAKELQQEMTKEQLNILKQDEENDDDAYDEDEVQTVGNPIREQVAAEAQQLTAAKNALDDQNEIDKFKDLIVKAISNKWLIPKVTDSDLTCKVLVNLGPGGVVISVEVVKESGDPILDQSAQAAIMKASPLPVPEDSELFDKFRSLRLTFRPEGIITG